MDTPNGGNAQLRITAAEWITLIPPPKTSGVNSKLQSTSLRDPPGESTAVAPTTLPYPPDATITASSSAAAGGGAGLLPVPFSLASDPVA